MKSFLNSKEKGLVADLAQIKQNARIKNRIYIPKCYLEQVLIWTLKTSLVWGLNKLTGV